MCTLLMKETIADLISQGFQYPDQSSIEIHVNL